jgi:hypothetical protein
LTILAIHVIILKSYYAWKNADIRDRMNKIKETEENYKNVVDFKKTHKGSITKKEEVIDDFTNKENK